MSNVAVVTGAGSGVGRAVALRLAQDGWSVAIVGRRPEALEETKKLAGSDATRVLSIPCDIGDESAVGKMTRRVLEHFGAVRALINAAGMNIPDRGLDVLTPARFREVIDTNLTGTLHCVLAFLPAMRSQGGGTIVNIVSDAGILASAKAGPAYAASKFGQRGLTQSINAEERGHGIRACAVCPGDINTPILDKRPVPPTPEARVKMLQPEDVAECVLLAINLPPRAIVEEILVRPR